MTEHRRFSGRRIAALVVLGAVLGVFVLAGAQIVRWKAHIWLPAYVTGLLRPSETAPDSVRHVVFIMVDHYEPGYGERGEDRNRTWLERFRTVADRHRDSYGNRFRYTWFYPYDHLNRPVLRDLARMSFEDYGEVELHWHHPETTNEHYPGLLAEAITWFRKQGCLREYGPAGLTRFAYIHGSWALDDSREWLSSGVKRRCGVTREMEFLQAQGCYADFTFPAFGTTAQPARINRIYYAVDTPARKSYDTGVDAEVGRPDQPGLLLVEGPIGFNLEAFEFEYGGVEGYALPTPRRIASWIDANIHVQGRPEWVFVKVFSHGQQFREAILDARLDPMLSDLERICAERGMRLHYTTAREAVNIVRAAERGETGDPEEYRDYVVGPRCDALFFTTIPVTIERMAPDLVAFRPDTVADGRYEFRIGTPVTVEGRLRGLRFDPVARTLELDAEGEPRVQSDEPLAIRRAPTRLASG